jgi:hypothetical protein
MEGFRKYLRSSKNDVFLPLHRSIFQVEVLPTPKFYSSLLFIALFGYICFSFGTGIRSFFVFVSTWFTLVLSLTGHEATACPLLYKLIAQYVSTWKSILWNVVRWNLSTSPPCRLQVCSHCHIKYLFFYYKKDNDYLRLWRSRFVSICCSNYGWVKYQ